MKAFAAVVMTLVFVDEVACMAAFAVWGWGVGGVGGIALAVVAPAAAMTAWFLFASPKARYGGGFVRPVTKLVVFGLASLALWHAGHPGWASVLLMCSAVVNGLAQLPSVRGTARDLGLLAA